MQDDDATGATQPFLETLNVVLGPSGSALAARQVAEAGPAVDALDRLRTLIEGLRTELSGTTLGPIGTTLMTPVFRRLTSAAAGYDDDAFERHAREVYERPAVLHGDLLAVLAVAAAPEPAIEILSMQQYVQGAAVPESRSSIDLDELIIDRRLVLARLTIDVATTAPHQIEELSANFEIFRQRYESAYMDYHRHYHGQIAALRSTVTDAAQPLRALTIFNQIEQLGPAVGSDLREQAAGFIASLTPCEVTPANLRAILRTQPHCSHCALAFSAYPASAEVERWQHELADAMDSQLQQLARAMATHAVRETGRPGFDRFLRAVRAGDIAPIVNVIDEEIADLIRVLLTDDQ